MVLHHTHALQEPEPGSYQVLAQRQPDAKVTNRDLATLDGTNHVNDCIITAMLRPICDDYPNVHIASTFFFEKLRTRCWDEAKKCFRDRREEAKGIITERQLQLPSLDAPILIIPIHGNIHWNPLIRDARGVGLMKARWRFYDTKKSEARERWVYDIFIKSPLWKEAMTWETVDTPQQEKDDCGPMSGAITMSYVRWSARLSNHERLNSNDLQLTTRVDAIRLGRSARNFARQTITNRSLPTQEENETSRNYLFRMKPRQQEQQNTELAQPRIVAAPVEPQPCLPPKVMTLTTRPDGHDPFNHAPPTSPS
jgi:hypothetical protein